MTFGQGYQPMHNTVLDYGVYDARIKSVHQGTWKTGQAKIEIEFEVKGFSHCQPNKIVISDYPTRVYDSCKIPLEQVQKSWNIAITEFFENFQIPLGDFNFNDWYGKIGKVTCRPQKKNPQYRELVAGKKNFYMPQNLPPKQQENYQNDNWSNCPPPDDWSNSNYPPY